MSRRGPLRILRDSLDEHPAVQAWRTVVPDGAIPATIEVFCERPHWLLYGLQGAGPAGSTVIAKRRRASEVVVERAVYERILPTLAVTVPRYYGSKTDGEFVWVLLQAVDGTRYSESNPEHLALAARWVATMHTAAATLTGIIPLPSAGPERYRSHLVTGRAAIQRSLRTSQNLDRAGRSRLDGIVSQLDLLENRWQRITALCEDAPTTLIHGDFRPKNAYVRRDGAGLAAFDWETAGWGPPAPDLTRIDPVAYWSAVRESWPAVSRESVFRWVSVGRVFQNLAAIAWEGLDLSFDSTEMLSEPLANLRLFAADLTQTLETTEILA
jgi:hypothetical protein